jgi:outer membrane immunogenic protein
VKRSKLIVAAGVAVTAMLGIGAASAADLPVKAPAYKAPPPLVYSWTGFYVGANIGGGWGRQSVDYLPNDPLATFLFLNGGAPPSSAFTTSGVLGGIQIGYNWQLKGPWLIGVETDFDGSGLKGAGSTGGVFAPYGPQAINALLPFSAQGQEQIDWFGTVRARLGYLPMDNLLVYATGGFAYGRFEQNGSWVNVGNNPFSVGGGYSFWCMANSTCFAGSSSGMATGWTVGAGFEYSLSQKWSLKGEYLYVSLDSRAFTESALLFAPGELPASFNANLSRSDFNVARVGLNYHF